MVFYGGHWPDGVVEMDAVSPYPQELTERHKMATRHTEWGTETTWKEVKKVGAVFISTVWDDYAAQIENDSMEEEAERAGHHRTQIRHFWLPRLGFNFYYFPEPKAETKPRIQFREKGY
jgi:hypothetical protein